MIKQQRWKKVEYTKRQINDAGDIIRKEDATAEEVSDAITVIDNWRASHAFPLHVMYIHLRRMAQSCPNALVVERLKRLDSIIGKLKRESGMDLWRMQDLGGCRVIVPTITDVYRFIEKYQKSSIRHEYKRTYDYIKNPKKSGYRSVHLVYKYHSDKSEDYNQNMLIELQFRTHLQHIWATALETMGLFTKQALKAGQGDAHIKRFFVLVSSLFAMREECPVIPGTLADEKEIVSEIEQINDQYHVLETLNAIRIALNHEEDVKIDRKGYYLLILNYNTHRLRIRTYQPSQFEQANIDYTQIEKNRHASGIDAVLVRATSFSELKSAYPNYFADIGEFYDMVTEYLK
ncbi:MAG: RelA/SpoT domain-containing protein [Clostridia bacterium]|nr:RelA/SpoT domain-containing protein [Clostridia bacterium]